MIFTANKKCRLAKQDDIRKNVLLALLRHNLITITKENFVMRKRYTSTKEVYALVIFFIKLCRSFILPPFSLVVNVFREKIAFAERILTLDKRRAREYNNKE